MKTLEACELRVWQMLGPLPPGKGGRETTTRNPREPHIVNVHFELMALEREMCAQVKGWQANYDYVPRPMSDGQKFFLILYSGHRSFGDIASHFHWEGSIQPICIDVAIHETHGNALNHEGWLDLIKSRRVVGGHAGPPSETYSAACSDVA